MERTAVPFVTTVVTPAASKYMTSVANFKTYVGITSSADDALIDVLIKEASSGIVDYVGRELASEGLTSTFRVASIDVIDALVLPRFPVTAITTVTEDGTVLDTDEYEFVSANGFVYRLDDADQRIAWAGPKVTIAYTAGYVMLTAIPPALERACKEYVKMLYQARTRDAALSEVSIPGVISKGYQAPGVEGVRLPLIITNALDAYRNTAIV